MYVVFKTNEGKIFYDIFNMLRMKTPKANICMLNQISAYLTRSGFVNDVSNDLKLEYCIDRDISVLSVSNGMKIEFNDYTGEFGFVIKRVENRIFLRTVVELVDQKDPSSLNIYSELKIKGNGMYVVTFRPKNLCNDKLLKFATINYYTEDEIDWVKEVAGDEINDNFDIVAKNNFIFPFSEKCEFDLLGQTDIVADWYQGYISNMLLRIDLLYDNVSIMKVKKKKREKKICGM